MVIDDSNLRHLQELGIKDRLERMIYLADDRNVIAKFVNGNGFLRDKDGIKRTFLEAISKLKGSKATTWNNCSSMSLMQLYEQHYIEKLRKMSLLSMREKYVIPFISF